MRIATSNLSETVMTQLQKLNTEQARLQSQVATGQRITQPEDDPAAVGRVLKLENQQREIAQYGRNADRALQLSQASFAGLQGMKSISDRATEIGTLSTGVQSPEALQAYATELDQLIEQGLQTANSSLSNEYLFGGTAVDAPPFTATRDAQGHVTAVSYDGNADQASIPLSETATVKPGTSGATNNSLGDLLNDMIALRDALNAGNSSAVPTIQTGLLDSEDQLVSALAEHGGVQMRIEVLQTEQASRTENLESLISSEADADLPTTLVRLTQTQTAYEAALQSSAYIMRLSLLDYIN
jgi:flagellar hook-associated protein 3 FlgL